MMIVVRDTWALIVNFVCAYNSFTCSPRRWEVCFECVALQGDNGTDGHFVLLIPCFTPRYIDWAIGANRIGWKLLYTE